MKDRSPVPVVAAALVLAVSSPARARRPLSDARWWAGLDPAAVTARAEGVKSLRLAPAGRVRIPGGTFTMGSTGVEMLQGLASCSRAASEAAHCRDPGVLVALTAEGAAHAVTLSAFEMDRTEVRVADYARCVSAGACARPAFAPTDARFAEPELPVTQVRWEDANAYCTWAGGRLPTEAEWEYAARGVDGREFPWGNQFNGHLANHGSAVRNHGAFANDWADATDGFVGLAPVGSFPDGATPLGLLDMAGNAAEWVADLIELDADGRPAPYPADPEVNPPPKTPGGGVHVARGGSYLDAGLWLRAAARHASAAQQSPWVGFRCAADAP